MKMGVGMTDLIERLRADSPAEFRVFDKKFVRELAYKIERLIELDRQNNTDLLDKCQEIERLRAALEKYGWHTGDCNLMTLKPDGTTLWVPKCDCGFEEALQGNDDD